MRPEPAIDDLALHGELSANLVGFCRLLRTRGASIGPGEEIDALSALEVIDLKDPQAFRLGLRTTLAKTPEEQARFDEFFDHYWQIWARANELNRPQPNPDRKEATSATLAQPRKAAVTRVREWLKQGDPTEEEREAAGYSPIEVETQRDFKEFNDDESEEIGRLLQAIARARHAASIVTGSGGSALPPARASALGAELRRGRWPPASLAAIGPPCARVASI